MVEDLILALSHFPIPLTLQTGSLHEIDGFLAVPQQSNISMVLDSLCARAYARRLVAASVEVVLLAMRNAALGAFALRLPRHM